MSVQDELRGIADSLSNLADDWGYAPRVIESDVRWLRELADHLDKLRDLPLLPPVPWTSE